MTDTVYITGLTAETVIGVYDHERGIKQSLVIDLELRCDTLKAGKSDDVADALDYDAISTRSLEFIEASQYYLLEALAENLAERLLKEFPIESLKMKISKPGAVARARDVGLIIERPSR